MFDRIINLIGEDSLKEIQKKKVLIVGIGGVGGTALEALVRSGIKNITIIDYDSFEESNLNRQILATNNDIGKYKTDVALKRIKDINNKINIKIENIFLDKNNISNLDQYDYIIDACDTIDTKVALIEFALSNNIKIISSMGTGKRINPSELVITTLDKTYNDPLAKKMRQALKNYNLKKIPVVFSKELPINNNTVIGSMIMVPSTAGLLIAYYVINDILKKE